MMKKRVFMAGFIVVLASWAVNSRAGNVNDEIIYTEESSSMVVKAPTEGGVLLGGNYFRMDSRDGSHEKINKFYAGPGVFFDYRFNEYATLSAQGFVFYEKSSVFDKVRIYNPGLFIKHWINPGWGYIGMGIEALYLKENIGGRENTAVDYMLSFIITGENVRLSRAVNVIGDLKAGISVSNNAKEYDVRYRIQYSIGFGIDWKK